MGLFSRNKDVFVNSFKDVPTIMEHLNNGKPNLAYDLIKELAEKGLEIDGTMYRRPKDSEWIPWLLKTKGEFVDFICENITVSEDDKEETKKKLKVIFDKVYLDQIYWPQFDKLCDEKNGFWNGSSLNVDKANDTIVHDWNYAHGIKTEAIKQAKENYEIRTRKAQEKCQVCAHYFNCKNLSIKNSIDALKCIYFE